MRTPVFDLCNPRQRLPLPWIVILIDKTSCVIVAVGDEAGRTVERAWKPKKRGTA
jgi:hypothetical protein